MSERKQDYRAKPPQKLTYEDYAKLPEEVGYTIELIDGEIVKEPSPTFLHQRISRRLQEILINHFRKTDPKGEIFNAPLDLLLNNQTTVQPDLLYFPSSRPVQRNPVDSLPELVVEILSPRTVRIDRFEKLNCYQQAQIPHYWLVDPDNESIQCHKLINEYYDIVAEFTGGTFKHKDFPNLTFELSQLFSENI